MEDISWVIDIQNVDAKKISECDETCLEVCLYVEANLVSDEKN